MRAAFYTVMAITIFGLFLAAVYFQCRSEDHQALSYPKMAPDVRKAEFDALKVEIAKPVPTAQQYFKVLSRLAFLEAALTRADQEERDPELKARMMLLSMRSLQDDWSRKLSRDIAETKEFKSLSNSAMASDPILNTPHHQEWNATLLWLAFLIGPAPLFWILFAIRLKDMKCRVWPEVISNPWRFFGCSFGWMYGVFKYPDDINPKEQLKIAWERINAFASLALASSMSFFAAVPAGAQANDDPGPGHTLHIDASTFTVPEYLGENGADLHPAPLQQSNVTISSTNGFYGGVWDSVPLAGFRQAPDFGYEIDLYAGWNGAVHGFKLASGMRYVDVAALGQIKGDPVKVFFGASHELHVHGNTLEPYFIAEHLMPIVGTKPRAGTWLHEGMRYSRQLTPRFSIASSLELMHDSGALIFGDAYLAQAGAVFNVKVRERWSLQLPAIAYSDPLTHVTDGRRPECVLGVGLSYHH